MSKVLGIIPARGGSKTIPHKNIRPMLGRPLMAYTVEAARESGSLDRLILSTDSEQIAAVGRELGLEVPFLRPPELSQDDTPMLPVLQHAVRTLADGGWQAEMIVLLQPTCPLRRPEHIREAVALLRELGSDSVVSVVPIPDMYAPQKSLVLEDGYLTYLLPAGRKITRRQMLRQTYARNGLVYAFWRDTLLQQNSIYGSKWAPYVMGYQDSISIDTPEDWAEAERRLRQRRSS